MANPPPSSHLTPGFEYDWFAVHLGNLGEAPWITGKAKVGPCGSLHGLAQDKQFLWYVRTGEPDKATFTQREGNGWLATDESAAQDVLTIRQNLASLGRWPGSATNEAIRLARAIESAANVFLQTAEPESMCYVWQLPVTYTTAATLPQQPQCEHVSIKLFPTREGWKINAREIEAILSLWSYSAHKAEVEDASDSCQNLGHEETELHLEGECRMGLRLLDRTCTKKRLLQDLRWWLPELDLKIFEVKYTTPESSAAGSAVKKKVCRQRLVGVGESELANSASFGEVLHFFSRDADEGDQSDAETDLEFGDGTLAVQSFDTLERLFSRELFHSFIRTIAKRKDFHVVESVMPELSFEGQDTDNESFKFSNGDLSDLAAKISSEGWGTLPEILFELIMPLSIESKLSGVKAIVKEAQEKAQRHEMACEWVELTKMCQWLFDLAAKSDLSLSSWCVQAWTVCIHFFYKLVCEGKLMQREGRRTADELDALLEQLKGEFRKSLTVSQFLELLRVRGEREKADVVAEALQISLEGAGAGFSESFPDSFEMNSAHLWTLGRVSEPLSDKASYHLQDAFGCYPIHYASLLSSKEMIDSFVRDSQSCSYGLDSRDIFGWTALHYACLRGDEPIVASLLESNGHGGVSIVGNDGVLPMHCAARSGHTRVLDLLLLRSGDADPESHALDHNGRNPIHWAAVEGHVEAIKVLMTRYAHIQDRVGWTSLHIAAYYGHTDLVEYLVSQSGVDVNQADIEKNTPLHLAASRRGCIDAACILAAAGATLEVQNSSRMTPLEMVCDEDREKIYRASHERGRKCTAGLGSPGCAASNYSEAE